ncbi:MAG TPA: NlpC/P60 family protein [Chthoniobacteraceae bacterium]|nr:NlpC/P60 family protein [Chthoniobacteraceae bacterium]
MKTASLTLIIVLAIFARASGQDATPSPTPHHKYGAAKTSGDSTPTPTPHPTKKKTKKPVHTTDSDDEATPTPKPSPSPDETPAGKPTKEGSAADATIDSSELAEFNKQPEKVRKLIESALALTRMDLTYTYGSADPANGGMDCSGFIYYVLRENGFNDVPRDASEQYIWVRKAKTFQAVLSMRQDGFEFDDLRPGDLLFWVGTYDVKRDPPVSHTMIYLGTEKATGKPVMVGSTDGRSYHGKSRWGVSVFDFKANTTAPGADPQKKTRAVFVGYARIPSMATKSLFPLP